MISTKQISYIKTYNRGTIMKKLIGLIFITMGFLTPNIVWAVIVMADTTAITLANSQIEEGVNTSSNPNVVNGQSGPLISYIANGPFFTPPFGASPLNNGDIGAGVPGNGFYSILNGPSGSFTLDFATIRTLGSIAIYNGYGNRTNGNYTLKDDSDIVLGAWTISGVSGNSNDGVDSFWFLFDTPFSTSNLKIEYDNIDGNTPSFREIQVFASHVPIPAAVWLFGSSLLVLTGMRKRATTLKSII